MARLIHRLRSDDPGQHYALLQAARKRLSAGGARRLRHTLPPIAFAALDIVRRLAAAGSVAGEPSQKEVRRPLCLTVQYLRSVLSSSPQLISQWHRRAQVMSRVPPVYPSGG